MDSQASLLAPATASAQELLSCRVRYLSAIAELRHVQSTEIIRAATRKTMMSRNPAAASVCGWESG